MQSNSASNRGRVIIMKRVFAIRRASDGSAYQKCGTCGVSVAVALADMHHCERKMEAKRFKGIHGMRMRLLPQNNQHLRDQPISPYRLFMESFMKGCKMENYIEMDRIGFEKWKKMSKEEKQPYVSQARALDYRHQEALNQEANEIIKVNDGADSAMAGKVDKSQWIYYVESSEDSEE